MPPVTGGTGPRGTVMLVSMAPRPYRPLLLRREGIDAGAVHSLDRGSLSIGRGPGADLVIRDPGLSRVHARIFRHDGGWYIEDLGSTNATLLNGSRVNRSQIADGDVVQLGAAVSLAFAMVTAAQEDALRGQFEAARTDPVTGALQAQHFDRQLMAAVDSAADSGEALSVMRFRLDGHDRLLALAGRTGADALLGRVATTIQERLGTQGRVARLGDTEFAVLLPGVELGAASRTAERLRVAVASAHPMFQGGMMPLSVSIGVASFNRADTPTSVDLMERAEHRLQQAASKGGNQVVSEG